jgi:protein import protein ZIM17
LNAKAQADPKPQIFNDTSTTVEQILAQRGESVKKGHLGGNGDMEFWDDGSTSTRDDTQPKQDGEPTAIEGQKS